MTTIDVLREQVAVACRVIALEGYVDLTLGHVSGREPGSRTIWIKRKGVVVVRQCLFVPSHSVVGVAPVEESGCVVRIKRKGAVEVH